MWALYLRIARESFFLNASKIFNERSTAPLFCVPRRRRDSRPAVPRPLQVFGSRGARKVFRSVATRTQPQRRVLRGLWRLVSWRDGVGRLPLAMSTLLRALVGGGCVGLERRYRCLPNLADPHVLRDMASAARRDYSRRLWPIELCVVGRRCVCSHPPGHDPVLPTHQADAPANSLGRQCIRMKYPTRLNGHGSHAIMSHFQKVVQTRLTIGGFFRTTISFAHRMRKYNKEKNSCLSLAKLTQNCGNARKK